MYFRDFDLKSDVKIFFHIHFCRARRALSNHIKYFRKKKFTPLLNYAHLTLTENCIQFVPKEKNPPNVPQARPIEDLWGILKQMVYANSNEAKNLDQFAGRIKKKFKN